MIRYWYLKHLQEKRVYFGVQVQRNLVHHVREAGAEPNSRMLGGSHFTPKQEAKEQARK